MLRIAVQSKGRLYDETMLLLEEAGIKLNRGKRILLLSAKGFPVEVLFLRDDDIPQSVANGVADIGIVGENEYVEKGERLVWLNDWASVNAVYRWLFLKMKITRVWNGLKERLSLLPIRKY